MSDESLKYSDSEEDTAWKQAISGEMDMNKTLDKVHGSVRSHARDWRKSMSDNVAYALIVYTALHIFATVGAMKETGMKSMALLALVVLIAAILVITTKNKGEETDEEKVTGNSSMAFENPLYDDGAATVQNPVSDGHETEEMYDDPT